MLVMKQTPLKTLNNPATSLKECIYDSYVIIKLVCYSHLVCFLGNLITTGQLWAGICSPMALRLHMCLKWPLVIEFQFPLLFMNKDRHDVERMHTVHRIKSEPDSLILRFIFVGHGLIFILVFKTTSILISFGCCILYDNLQSTL